MAADGSVIIDVEVDGSDADKEFSKLTQSAKKLEKEIYDNEQKRLPLQKQLDQLTVQADAAAAKLHEMQNAAVGTYSKEQIDAQAETVRALGARWDDVHKQLTKCDNKIQDATAKLAQTKEKAGGVARSSNEAAKSVEKMGSATKKANKHMGRFALRVREVVRSALVFTVITQALSKLRDWIGSVIKSSPEATQAIARLKGALLTMAQPLVEVVIPAFVFLVNVLTRAVTAIAQIVATLFGTTAKDAANAAENLHKEQNALEGVGNAAKKATRQLAGFDEINQLSGESAGSASSVISPDFSGLSFLNLPEWLSSITLNLRDILFKWENLTKEDILKKIVAVLTAIAGGVIGFSIGGVKGAVIGMVLGASLGAWISSVLFDNDGKISKEKVLKSICTALGALVGGVLGFAVGGLGGAAVGVTVGASAGALLSKLIFDNDGVVSKREVITSICTALGALVGGILGFSLGGPGGALVGVSLGAAVSATISELVFGGENIGRNQTILRGLCGALGAIVGGVIGFAIGGPGGALIGITIGAGVTIKLTDIIFKGFEDIKKYNPNFTGFGPDYSWMFKSSSVPGLANGSVIPPNRKFLAVLGDNKTETEVVSPLSTMKQAMIEALRESGGAGGGTYTLVVNLDGKEIARNQIKHINNMTIESGKPVLIF